MRAWPWKGWQPREAERRKSKNVELNLEYQADDAAMNVALKGLQMGMTTRNSEAQSVRDYRLAEGAADRAWTLDSRLADRSESRSQLHDLWDSKD